ncbi:MAG: excalibur calcium-binding domain-containing protein [Alteraurantiacibacter sp. bin_em_oilr2.035]|nr:excalibur calcium-binding domain-containing protein [Alteraurantiacibacter sp. bin_em_oilr2.035]
MISVRYRVNFDFLSRKRTSRFFDEENEIGPLSLDLTGLHSKLEMQELTHNCTAVHAAGALRIFRGDPGYVPHLNRDNDVSL